MRALQMYPRKIAKLFLVNAFLLLAFSQALPANPQVFSSSGSIGSFPHQLPSVPEGKKVVLVGGVFDLIHYGHLNFLKQAKQQGDYLIVAIEPDEFIKQRKKRKPIHTQQQRAELLAHMDMVDQVILLPVMHGYKDYLALVQAVRPRVIAVTEGDPYKRDKESQARQIGAKVVSVVSRDATISTTQILRRMCK
jgi:FAD synthetase